VSLYYAGFSKTALLHFSRVVSAAPRLGDSPGATGSVKHAIGRGRVAAEEPRAPGFLAFAGGAGDVRRWHRERAERLAGDLFSSR